jgi:hypothetical protein
VEICFDCVEKCNRIYEDFDIEPVKKNGRTCSFCENSLQDVGEIVVGPHEKISVANVYRFAMISLLIKNVKESLFPQVSLALSNEKKYRLIATSLPSEVFIMRN